MTLFTASSISKSFGERTLFDEVGFNINEGDKIGLIGANGCGKTTLLKLITGELSSDTGGFSRKSGLRIGYLEQHACKDSQRTTFEEALTVFEYLIELQKQIDKINASLKVAESDDLLNKQAALQEKFIKEGGLTFVSRTRATLLGLGFSEDELLLSVSNLSGGQKSKIGLAKLLLCEPELILLDEPTNHLDTESVEWLEDFLLSSRAAALIISHDRYFLDKLTNRTFELKHGKLYQNNGNYTRHKLLEAEREKAVAREYENKMREIKRIEGIIEQQRTFSMERNYKTIDHKQKSIDRIKESLVVPEGLEAEVDFSFSIKSDTGNDVLFAQNVSKSFESKTLFSNVTLDIKRGQKVFLLGANGCGKTTLLKEILRGEKVKFGARVSVGYFDQMQADLPLDSTIFEVIREAHQGISDTKIRAALATFLFRGDEVYRKVGALSGGERARVALCRLMLAGDNLLFLDEPTNHLDIRSREVLEKALKNFGGTLIVVSHDRYFINTLATDIMLLEDGNLKHFKGDYDYFVSHRIKPEVTETTKKREMGAGGVDYHQRKEKQAKIRKLRADIKRYEKEIEIAEIEIKEIQTKLSSPQISGDYKEVAELSKSLDTVQNRLDEIFIKWDTATCSLEELEGEA